jgi:hypothetical protein
MQGSGIAHPGRIIIKYKFKQLVIALDTYRVSFLNIPVGPAYFVTFKGLKV